MASNIPPDEINVNGRPSLPAAIAHEGVVSARASIPAVPASISTGNEEPRYVDYPDSPFHLYQPYPPGGDQPNAINQLE